MRTASGLVVGAVAFVLVSGVAASETSSEVFRRAAIVTLSNGQVVPVLSTRSTSSGGSVATMVFVGEAGAPIVCTQDDDKMWGVQILTVTDGKKALVMRYGAGFFRDGLTVPLELRLGSTKIYRWFMTATGESTSQTKAMQKAIADLPDDFQKNLVTFCTLSDTDVELMLPTLGIIAADQLFAERLPRVAVQELKSMKPEDVAKFFPDRVNQSSLSPSDNESSRVPKN
jgi:hypothetical protein